ncbi:hypothetical protein C0J52_10613 [Blattella germanica]|nr:hypothetical protein C0J52_10613 [Blattella germanica]
MWQILFIAAPLLACPIFISSLETRQICADLCFSGLGGAPCGLMCNQEIGVALRSQLRDFSIVPVNKTQIYGPRRNVCSKLCNNNLGHPLCGCATNAQKTANWTHVCEAFCEMEGHTLYGCPKCFVKPNHTIQLAPMRKNGDLDWEGLCNYLCNMGEGGSACSCDVLP